MKLGTISIANTLCNLDTIEIGELEKKIKSNKNEKDNEINIIKNVCQREVSNDTEELLKDIPEAFSKFIANSNLIVKNEALLYRALVNRTTEITIQEKTNNQKNALTIEIQRIVPKYDEANKKYESVNEKKNLLLANYEKNLRSLADFYDNKIEQLILKRVEFEANLVGKIVTEEFYIEEEKYKKEAKENDKIINTLSNSIKNVMQKLTKKKEEKEIDITMISKLKDKEDIIHEQDENLKKSIDKSQALKVDSVEEIKYLEEQIVLIEKEIRKLNENKKKILINAMESQNKEIVISKEKLGLAKKIKKFFQGRFNSTKAIVDNVLNPFEKRIKDFEQNELENISE